MIKLLVFDWDDVFVLGATQAYITCYSESLAEAGIVLPHETVEKVVRGFWGRPHREVLAQLLPPGQPQTLLEQAEEAYTQYLFSEAFTRQLRLVPGALGLLSTLKQRYRLALATSANARLLRTRLLPRYGLLDTFHQIATYQDLPDPSRGKPHPDLLRLVMARENVSSREVLVVGDAEADVAMAVTTMCTPVVVLTGQLDQSTARRLGVQYVIPDVSHI
jgi:phosphoglycolate phosphatase